MEHTDIYRSSASLSVSLSPPPPLSAGGSPTEGGGQEGDALSAMDLSSVMRATPHCGSTRWQKTVTETFVISFLSEVVEDVMKDYIQSDY